MTANSPIRESWRLAWPLILSNISVPLLGIVDTAVVGHLADPVPLGAVALGSTIVSVAYFLLGFLRMGTTGLTAQAIGAGDHREAISVLARAVLLGSLLGLLVMLASPLLVLAAHRLYAPEAGLGAQMDSYIVWRLLGAPAALGNFALLGWMLGNQNSRGPLVLLVVTNALNAVLVTTLVVGFGFGVGGVAAATAIAEWAGFALGIVLVRRIARGLGVWPDRDDILHLPAFHRLVAVNRDLFLRSFMIETVFLTFSALSARQGVVLLAANAVLMNFFTFASYGLDGFAFAAEAMIGKAVGSRDQAAFRAAARAGFVNAAVLAVVMAAVFAVTGPFAVRLMTGIAPVREAAMTLLPYVVAIPPVAIWAFLLDGVFIGATRSAELRNGMAIALAMFVLAVFTLPQLVGNDGLWLALLIFLGARGLVLWLFYRRADNGAAFAAG